MVRSVRYSREGGPEVLEVVDVELPAPAAGEVRLNVSAIGINFADIYQRRGTAYAVEPPSGIGFEAAGTVAAVGAGVTNVSIGDRVAVVDGADCYAEAINTPAAGLIALPDTIDDRTAVALFGKAMTVEYLLERCAPVAAGQTILFHAAAGGVGLIACQWAKALGVTTIGTVSTAAKAELAAANGCNHVIISSEEDFVGRVQQITDGAGVAVVFDSIGRDTMQDSLKCVARRGTLVSFGQSSGHADAVLPRDLNAQGSIYLTRPNMADYTHTKEELQASASRVVDMYEAGAIAVHIGQTYALDDVVRAHTELETRRTVGQSIIVPNL